jgi:hypothetical protein
MYIKIKTYDYVYCKLGQIYKPIKSFFGSLTGIGYHGRASYLTTWWTL